MITVIRSRSNKFDEQPEDNYPEGKSFLVQTGYLYIQDGKHKPIAVYNSSEWSHVADEV